MQGYQAAYQDLFRSQGNGDVSGEKVAYQDFVWWKENFHEFRGLIQLRTTFEKQAYATIAASVERLRVFNNARSEAAFPKRLQQLHEATTVCEQKMAEYQHLSDVLDLT